MHRRLPIFAAVAALPLALAACNDSKPEVAQTGAITAVERWPLNVETLADLKPVGGQVTTRDEVQAVARIGGILIRLDVKAGDRVQAGQRIALINDDRINLAAGAAGAAVAGAQAESARANADLKRIRELHAAGVYADARLEQTLATAKAADARLKAARDEAAAARALGGQGAVLAAAAGRVLLADVPPGSPVMPGQLIARLSAGPLVVRLDVPEAIALAVKPGDTAQLSEPGLPAQGRVAQVWPGVTGGMVRVDLAVPGLSDALMGRRVSALLPAGTRPALVVPRRFVRIRHGIAQVLVQDGKTITSVPVEVSDTADPAAVELLSGVAAGDVLVRGGNAAK